MKKAVYVVDTSYLVEYYKVDGHYKDTSHREIWQRFNTAITNRNRLYIPVPVIFELANHIAHIKNGYHRQKLAEQFVIDVENSLSKESPFNLVPCQDFQYIENLLINLQKFATEYAGQGLGLTDTAVYLQAHRLYQDYQKFNNYTVHIRGVAIFAKDFWVSYPKISKNHATRYAFGCPSRPGHSLATQQGVSSHALQ